MVKEVKELIVTIANAKTYVFFHEIGHITSLNNQDYYIKYLRDIFSDELIMNTYKQVVLADPYLRPKERAYLKKIIYCMRDDLYTGNYMQFEEIIADMRALHSMCSNFMLIFPNDIPYGFLQFKEGISLARSFNLRIRFLDAAIRNILISEDLDEYRKNMFESQFGREFFIRDKLSEITQTFMFMDCFGKRCSKKFLIKYSINSKVASEVTKSIDVTVFEHLYKLWKRINDDKDLDVLDGVNNVLI